eukprot:1145038-Pelagomonas_calceolata.AAC.3
MEKHVQVKVRKVPDAPPSAAQCLFQATTLAPWSFCCGCIVLGCEKTVDGSVYGLTERCRLTSSSRNIQISNRLNGAKRFGGRFGLEICCRNKNACGSIPDNFMMNY